MMEIKWIVKTFGELLPSELYDALKLRQEVFVVEQHCSYLDADGKDPECYHLLGYVGRDLACYARIVKPGISYMEVSIGRVCTARKFRGKGLARMLLKAALEQSYRIFGKVPVRIGAQAYLKEYYESFGFEIAGPSGYFEDGILHYIMLKK